jgi:murein DD-endopeptidase MepM/ murein hydrolase activator NlpD
MPRTVGELRAVLVLDSSGYIKGLAQADKEGQHFSQSADKMGSSLSTVGKVAGIAFAAVSAAAVGLGVTSVMAAARVGEMDAALSALSKATGVSKDQMDAQVKSVREAGIQYGTAQSLVAQFTRSQLDVAKATDLARVAQNLAIFTQQDSSETLDELLHGIQTGNTQLNVFRQLNLNAADAVAKYAAELGKSTSDLTSQEKQQALLNGVIEAGVSIQGAYASAMEEPGKVMRSFPRYINDIQVSIGKALLPAFKDIILTGADVLKTLGGLVDENGALRPLIERVGKAVSDSLRPVISLAQGFASWLKALDRQQVQQFGDVLERIFQVLTWIGPPLLAMVVAWKAYTVAVTIAKAAQAAFNLVMHANPIGLVVLAIVGLIAVFVLLYQRVEPFRQVVDLLWGQFVEFGKALWQFSSDALGAIGGFVGGVIGFFQSAFGFLVPFVSNNWEKILLLIPGLNFIGLIALVVKNWDAITGFFRNALSFIGNLISGAWESYIGLYRAGGQAVLSFLSGWGQAVAALFGGVRDAVVDVITDMTRKMAQGLNWAIDRVNDFLTSINDGLGKFGVEIDWKLDRIPEHARGGIVKDRTYVAGEGRAPEAIIPFDQAYRGRAEQLWTATGKALGFFGAMGGPGGSQGDWYPGSFPLAQGPGGSFSHQSLNAWDYMMPNGTPILMGLPGVVVPGPGGGYGTSLGVNLDSGGSVILGHLGSIVKTGRAEVGETIGLSDNTGFSTGPHLHLEFRDSLLAPGPGGAEGTSGPSMDIGSMISGWAEEIVKKFAPDTPPWLDGILNGLIVENAKAIAGWIVDNFKDRLNSVVNFVGELAGKITGKVTPGQLHDWMDQIGFMPAGGFPWADKIVGRESGWDPGAIGPQWNGDGGSRGLWQIQPGAHPQYDKEKLLDGLYNTEAAFAVYRKQGPNAWSTNYDTGGIWPSGMNGVNRSGSSEVVLNAETFRRLLTVLERLDEHGAGNRQVQVTVEGGAGARQIGDEVAWQLRFA